MPSVSSISRLLRGRGGVTSGEEDNDIDVDGDYDDEDDVTDRKSVSGIGSEHKHSIDGILKNRETEVDDDEGEFSTLLSCYLI